MWTCLWVVDFCEEYECWLRRGTSVVTMRRVLEFWDDRSDIRGCMLDAAVLWLCISTVTCAAARVDNIHANKNDMQSQPRMSA
jgi:hypothetical protein